MKIKIEFGSQNFITPCDSLRQINFPTTFADEDLTLNNMSPKSITGAPEGIDDIREIQHQFDKYNITILVDKFGKFMGINEVKVNKDFRDIQQRLASIGYLDVDDYYESE